MAKKLSRKQRKQAKQKQVQKLLKSGLKQSEISRLSNKEIEKKYTFIVSKEVKVNQRKQLHKKQQESRQKKLDWKRNSLEALGFDPKHAGRVKYEDIENYKRGNEYALSREKYPFLWFEGFDFDRIYKLKNGHRMFVAFRDYQGELDIKDEIEMFSRKSNGELVDGLEGIVNTPPSYQKGVKGSSSGKAGDYKFMIADQETIAIFNKEIKRGTTRTDSTTKGKRKRKRQHTTGKSGGYQVLKNGHRVSFDEMTPRNLLIMANAIMYNVTESDRTRFYSRFYTDIIKHIPDMKEILPKPKF